MIEDHSKGTLIDKHWQLQLETTNTRQQGSKAARQQGSNSHPKPPPRIATLHFASMKSTPPESLESHCFHHERPVGHRGLEVEPSWKQESEDNVVYGGMVISLYLKAKSARSFRWKKTR